MLWQLETRSPGAAETVLGCPSQARCRSAHRFVSSRPWLHVECDPADGRERREHQKDEWSGVEENGDVSADALR